MPLCRGCLRLVVVAASGGAEAAAASPPAFRLAQERIRLRDLVRRRRRRRAARRLLLGFRPRFLRRELLRFRRLRRFRPRASAAAAAAALGSPSVAPATKPQPPRAGGSKQIKTSGRRSAFLTVASRDGRAWLHCGPAGAATATG